MSVSLSQKLGPSVRKKDRFFIAVFNTDEIFAVASGQTGSVGRRYLYGLGTMPYLGWSLGTLVGAAAGNILPAAVVSALGIAIYGMFLAIIVPPAKKNKKAAGLHPDSHRSELPFPLCTTAAAGARAVLSSSSARPRPA